MTAQNKEWHSFKVSWTEKDGDYKERRYRSDEWPSIHDKWLHVGIYGVAMRIVKADSIKVLYGPVDGEPTTVGEIETDLVK